MHQGVPGYRGLWVMRCGSVCDSSLPETNTDVRDCTQSYSTIAIVGNVLCVYTIHKHTENIVVMYLDILSV